MLSHQRVVLSFFLIVGAVSAARIVRRRGSSSNSSAVQVAQGESAEAESIPKVVSDAIRNARQQAVDALQTAKEHAEHVEKRTSDAKAAADHQVQKEEEKQAAAKEAAERAAEKATKAKEAAAAANAVISSQSDWEAAEAASQAAQAARQQAEKNHNEVSERVAAEIRRIKKRIADAEAALSDATTKAEQAALDAEEVRITLVAAQKVEETEVQELQEAQEQLAEANVEMERASGEASAATRAAEEAQDALADATAEWTAAKAAVQAAKNLRDNLWDLYDAIDAFNMAISSLNRAMRRSDCTFSSKHHECLVSPDGERDKTKAVLKSYNDIILGFTKIQKLHAQVFQDICESEDEIERNAMSSIKLACDPDMELESAGDSADLEAKCGNGLWPAVGLTKTVFPAASQSRAAPGNWERHKTMDYKKKLVDAVDN